MWLIKTRTVNSDTGPWKKNQWFDQECEQSLQQKVIKRQNQLAELEIPGPTLAEVKSAISSLKNHKAPGPDGIQELESDNDGKPIRRTTGHLVTLNDGGGKFREPEKPRKKKIKKKVDKGPEKDDFTTDEEMNNTSQRKNEEKMDHETTKKSATKRQRTTAQNGSEDEKTEEINSLMKIIQQQAEDIKIRDEEIKRLHAQIEDLKITMIQSNKTLIEHMDSRFNQLANTPTEKATPTTRKEDPPTATTKGAKDTKENTPTEASKGAKSKIKKQNEEFPALKEKKMVEKPKENEKDDWENKATASKLGNKLNLPLERLARKLLKGDFKRSINNGWYDNSDCKRKKKTRQELVTDNRDCKTKT
ncbi:inner centromere protein A-like [Diabrotica virgifera virgifera]|uniref:Uncharacterized protein n=1 Tax=Diabrotica virgifera virgifera TaxID=50390 RepID=A0ABM5JRY6_DIAVI|nr:inner centromere protein A-like [Diabrotica virgifera virgifera]